MRFAFSQNIRISFTIYNTANSLFAKDLRKFKKNIFHFIKSAHLYTTENPAEYKCAVSYFQYRIFNGIEDTPRTV